MGVAVNVDSPFFGNGPVTLDSAPIRDLEVVHTPGHSPGSIGLLLGNRDDGRVLLCGDTLLDPITPLPDDLLSYLRTLDFIEKLSDVQVALPAHGLPIRNLAHRVAFLKRHHRNRLERTFLTCAEPTRVWDIATAPGYFDTYVDPTQFNFLAGNEALVHMELLTMVGGLSRCGIEDGVQYFRNSGEPFDEVYGRVLDLVNDSRAAAMMRY
jgi:glyoxylase-like metal-dependent hydrolase (beta-lactamase superfamily II)